MSAELTKSKLASKDKDELVQIAAAMGGKPPSRARKAEIIELIMTLANGGDAASGDDQAPEAGAESAPAAGYSADPMADARAEAQSRGGVARDSAPPKRNGANGRNGNGGNPERAPKASTKTPVVEADKPDPGKADDDQDDSDNGRGSDNRGGANNEGRDQAEPGNRRRRRRGRGRDRADMTDDWNGEAVEVAGILDLRDDGYGFLRVSGYLPTREDVYVSVKQVRQFGLRKGDHLKGAGRPANRSEKNPAMVRIDAVNNHEPEAAVDRPDFDDLVPVYPTERLTLEREGDPTNLAPRIIDLLAPIGKGQRGLIVAPPKVGKTTVLRDIVRSLETNDPDITVVVLLVDERPEEVTLMRQWMLNGDVVASTFDRPAEEHASVAELTLERAKRMVESGNDVVIVVDGITRLARAHNHNTSGSGRLSPDSIDSAALYAPKRLFGAARNVQDGGSLTVLATVAIETPSRVDDLIFEEFGGTATMELRLDRMAAEEQLFPAISIEGSSTRSEDQLLDDAEIAQLAKLRRMLAEVGESGPRTAPLRHLIDGLREFDTNVEYLKSLGS